jgi:molybdopterin-guanine dinucleotide biosynthesis protein A
MGRDKAALEVAGEPAAARLARVALEVACGVVVVGAPGRDLPSLPAGAIAAVDPPGLAGRGPLAGVVAGLRATAAERVFVLTVDGLALSPELLRALDALDEGAGVAPFSDRLQPFPSLLPRRPALALAERLLGAAGGRGPRATAWIDELAPRAATRELLLSIAALRERDPDLLALEDADDPAAAARLLARLALNSAGGAAAAGAGAAAEAGEAAGDRADRR